MLGVFGNLFNRKFFSGQKKRAKSSFILLLYRSKCAYVSNAEFTKQNNTTIMYIRAIHPISHVLRWGANALN